jgi:hypothetical protein
MIDEHHEQGKGCLTTEGHQQGRQQQQALRNIGNTVADGTSTAESLATARTPGASTAVRTAAAAGTPDTAETITTAGAKNMPKAEITSATAESVATAEATETFRAATSPWQGR